MSSRNNILAAIASNKPLQQTLPHIDAFADTNPVSLQAKMIDMLEAIGAGVTLTNNLQSLKKQIQEDIDQGQYIVNTLEGLGEMNHSIDINSRADMLEPIDKAYLKGTLGVAENGAIWVQESDMLNRLIPFICQHLVLIIDASNIVANMHEAYKKISFNHQGFGVFIAGPSKTADIEQSLVVGAHGARSLKVYILTNLPEVYR
jgi:L-lactate dehydrogenase complex protein LldG